MRIESGRLFWGLILVGAGGLYLSNNLGMTTVGVGDIIANWWPMVLIYFGVAGFVGAIQRRILGRTLLWGSLVVNGLVAGLGLALLGNRQGWFYVDLRSFWNMLFPAALILLGLTMLGRARSGRTYWAVMSGSKNRFAGEELKDIAVVAVMGGADLDLTGARLPADGSDVLIDVYTFMGGIGIKVPEGMPVTCEWTGFMGGINFLGTERGGIFGHDLSTSGEGPGIRIRAHTFMGGAKVMRR